MSAIRKPPQAFIERMGGGRPKGSSNKITLSIKAMVEHALVKAGGVDYLVRQAEENPVAFMSLCGRVLPMQVAVSGDGPTALHYLAATAITAGLLQLTNGQSPDNHQTINGETTDDNTPALERPKPSE